MSKLATSILFCALIALYGQTSDIAEYCQALAGELAACKQYLAECEAQRKDFSMRCEDRERAFSTENAKLKAEIERLQKQKQSLLEEKAKLSAEKQRLHENRQACLQSLTPAEQSLEAKRQQLPQSLAEAMLPPLSSDNPAARFSRFQESINSIRDFTKQPVKPISTVLTGPDGVQREFQILQLGLTFAYAVAPEAKIAGIGFQTDGVWTWQWKEECFPAIHKAVDICSGKHPPVLLPLPAITGEGGSK
jgi:hypothetical protein